MGCYMEVGTGRHGVGLEGRRGQGYSHLVVCPIFPFRHVNVADFIQDSYSILTLSPSSLCLR